LGIAGNKGSGYRETSGLQRRWHQMFYDFGLGEPKGENQFGIVEIKSILTKPG
jgi:hypothetical protein